MATLGIKSQAEIGGRMRLIARVAAEAALAADECDASLRRSRRRVTIRQLMFLVVFWALVMGAWRVNRWCAYCAERAEYHAGMEAFHSGGWPAGTIPAAAGISKGAVRARRALASYHSRMRHKWERAAAEPWRPVEPDPPPP